MREEFRHRSDRPSCLHDPWEGRERLARWIEGPGRVDVHALLIGFARFETVNLAFGSDAGDAALAETARRIETFAQDELASQGWFAGRLDGGKFLLAARGAMARDRWEWLAEALADALALPIAGGKDDAATVRLWPRCALGRTIPGESVATFLERLALALDRATREPARRVLWIDRTPGAPALRDRAIEADLLTAIDRDEIEIVFQPQTRTSDGSLAGAEALARWRHREHGELGAETLFAIAKRTDQLAPLTRRIAEKSLAFARDWPDGLRLSINITPADLVSVGFDRAFLEVLRPSGLDADRVTLEITEQVLLGDLESAAATLAGLKRSGLSIALDDFGAGFCNFRYLQRLPLDALKLDRALVADANDLPSGRAVLRAIVAMASALDLSVVAEGVETEAQRAIVAQEGCEMWQGFLRSGPLRPDAFRAYAAS